MSKKYIPYILWTVLGILVLYVVWPLLKPGFVPTHDGEYHLIRIWQFDRMISAGNLFPRWASDLNSGFGTPLFNFQYPFPNYIGVFWHHTGLSLADSVKMTLVTGYIGAIVFCALWLNAMFPVYAAFSGTVLFMFVPYWFVDIYVRGSVGEVVAMAWVMMALWAVEKKSTVGVALSIGLLVLTHNISAMIFVPVIVGYIVLRRPVLWRAVILGIGVSAYFWLPALGERQYVVGLNTVNFRDHFPRLDQLLIPSWGTGFSGGMVSGNVMSTQIGIIPMLLFIVSIILLVIAVFRKQRPMAAYWALIYAVGVFFMLPVSRPFWELLPGMDFIQYPWRLLSYIMLSVACLGAYVSSKTPKFVSVLFCFLAIILTVPYVRPVVYPARSDSYYLSKPNFTDGTSSLGDSFSTIWSPWIPKRAAHIMETESGEATIQITTNAPTRKVAKIVSENDSLVSVHILYYPGWIAYVDGKKIPFSTRSGIIHIPLHSGRHTVEVRFTETPLRLFADAVSFASVCVLFVVVLRKRRIIAHH
jgi:hypothetical protein